MEYLFATWDGGGSVGPELVLVRRLVERGHRVTMLAAPTLRTQIAAAGANFLPWQRVPHRRHASDPDPFVDPDLRTPKQLVDRLLDRVIARPAADYAAEVGAALDAQPADAVVATFTLFGALAAAESRGARRSRSCRTSMCCPRRECRRTAPAGRRPAARSVGCAIRRSTGSPVDCGPAGRPR